MGSNKTSILTLTIFILISLQFQTIRAGPRSALQNSLADSLPLFNIDFEQGVQTLSPTPRFRLPLNVIPSHYVLKQQVVLDVIDGFEQFQAPSEVTISVDCIETTPTITLHSHQLVSINEGLVKVADKDGVEIPISAHNYEDDKDFYIITLATPLQKDSSYNIHIPFVANISTDSPFGLSAARYVPNPANPTETSLLSVTTLEPHYARRVFPCFDEPNLKATFDIIIGHTSDYMSLAHTEIMKTETEGDWVWDFYERTVVMPTYLICMVTVSNTHYDAKFADAGIYHKKVGAWGLKSLIDRGAGDFAAETSAKSLDYFEKTYKFNYSLSKMDSIVVPGFPAGALENWGINTYRETVLLRLDNENTQANKASSASTISHEIAHQWFGNLVSCIFWDQIWLNEGFANYMAFRGVQSTNPEFNPHIGFPSDSVQPAMRADQAPNTHPVKFEEMPEDWMAIFDTISYSKGGSLLKMAEGFLTEEILTNGLIDFLNKMQYKGADQDDLFASLDKVAKESPNNPLPNDLTVKEILDTWTLQPGYPLVRVSKAGSSRIYISQERFALTPDVPVQSTWHVPLKIVSKSHPATSSKVPDLWMRDDVVLVSYGTDTSQWTMVNPDATGFYRVMYDNSLLTLIKRQLDTDPTEISPGSRSQLLDDYWNFGLANYIHINESLALTRYLEKESALVVWSSVLGNLNPTMTRLAGTVGFSAFETYMLQRIESALDKVGWIQTENDKGSPVILRALLLDWACGLGSTKCSDEAVRLYNAWEGQTDPSVIGIPVDLQSVYLCSAVARIGDDASDFITRQFPQQSSEVLKARLVSALACRSEADALESLLEFTLTSTDVRPVDRTLIFQRVAANPNGRSVAYNFIKTYLTRPGVGPSLFASTLSTLSNHFHTQADYDDLEAFLTNEANEPEFRDERIQISLNTSKRNILGNIQWKATIGDLVLDWMADEITH